MLFTLDSLKTTIGGLLSMAVGLVDLWHFEKLGTSADIVLLTAGLAALGVSAAFGAGMARSGLRPPGP